MDLDLDVPLSLLVQAAVRATEIGVETVDRKELEAMVVKLHTHIYRYQNAAKLLFGQSLPGTPLEERIDRWLGELQSECGGDVELVRMVLLAVKEDCRTPTGQYWWRVNLHEWELIKSLPTMEEEGCKPSPD